MDDVTDALRIDLLATQLRLAAAKGQARSERTLPALRADLHYPSTDPDWWSEARTVVSTAADKAGWSLSATEVAVTFARREDDVVDEARVDAVIRAWALARAVALGATEPTGPQLARVLRTRPHRALVTARLRDYTETELLDAVRGLCMSDWHRANDRLDISLALRDGARVEQFSILWRRRAERTHDNNQGWRGLEPA